MSLAIYNGIISAFMVSNIFSNEREIAAGGVINKIWLTSIQYTLFVFCMGPLSLAWPLISFNALSWGGAIGIYSLGALAYVSHKNLININGDSQDKLIKLPFNIHLSQVFQQNILLLQSTISYLILSIYVIAIIAIGLQTAGTAYVIASMAMIVVDQVKQRGLLPSFIDKPYFYAGFYLSLSSVFGVTSYFSIVGSILFIGYSLWDLISARIFKTRSDNILFSMSKEKTSLSLNNIGKKSLSFEKLKNLAIQISPITLKVTFDHLSQSYDAVNKLTKNVPIINFENYERLFNKIDFELEEYKEILAAQLLGQDDFWVQTYSDHKQDLGLPNVATEHEVRVSYLKNQMKLTVERLNQAYSKDLPQERILQLQKQARLILQFIDVNFNKDKDKDKDKCSRLLINIALRAGQHCTRMYVNTFSDLFVNNLPVKNIEQLSLSESFSLEMQEFREKTFNNYYFKTVKTLKNVNPVFRYLYSDVTDYHSYEDFVRIFGSSLYLKNPLLGQDLVKDPMEQIMVRYWKIILDSMGMGFQYDYNVEAMIKEILSPVHAPQLHKLFERWLKEKHANLYNDVVLDECFLIDSTSESVIGLVKLMLLDLKVADFEKPMDIKFEADNVTICEAIEDTSDYFDFFKSKPTDNDSNLITSTVSIGHF
tara:strand:- start:120 stop:2075 length:1956 start_codon:yes stop_codon:yes gene_type:complete